MTVSHVFVEVGYSHIDLYFRSTPHPVTVTIRIITFLVGNPYKPSFATVTGWGVDPTYTYLRSMVRLFQLFWGMGIPAHYDSRH